MKLLNAFQHGDGAHCGLSDWYERGEAELAAALADHAPFDTGWYGSKKEIASARIWSENGVVVKVDVSVSDDFDTEGFGYSSTDNWTLAAVAKAVGNAWHMAEKERKDNQEYAGFRIGRGGQYEETYLVNVGEDENPVPPGDYYHWWGWQHHETKSGQGIPHPAIPAEIVKAFEKWAQDWAFGYHKKKKLQIGKWTIIPWK